MKKMRLKAILAAAVIAAAVSDVKSDEFIIKDGMYSIEPGAFAGCSWMTSVSIPSSVYSIGTNAFYMCDNLTNITISSGNSIYSAQNGMVFSGRYTGKTLLFCAPGVEGDVTIPSDTYKIAPGAFARCGKITSVTIPANVMNIGSNAFWRCSSLTNITVDSGNSVYLSEDGVLYRYSSAHVFLVCCPGGLKKSPVEESSGNSFSLTVTNTVVNYVLGSVPAGTAVPPANSVGLVAVVTEIEGETFAVPSDWSAAYPEFETRYGSDLAKALMSKSGKRDMSGNELQVWQDYVACTDPTNPDDTFKATITFNGNEPVISWTPEATAEQLAVRTYTVYGKKRLNDPGWTQVAGDASDYNFFKVVVRMKR